MTRPLDAADTRMMGIVHDALRRDLLRVRQAVTSSPLPHGRQRQAIGDHVVWLMDFLHDHHVSEDEGLWPVVRERNPAAAELLDSLEADHRRIDPAAKQLRAAGRRYADTTVGAAQGEIVDALDKLAEVLFPHLDREVADAMPVVSATITNQDWRRIEQRYSIKPKSLGELGILAHWLLDGIDPEGYDVVTHTVPFVPRMILLHGFARAYRRRAQAIWAPDGAPASKVHS